MKKMVEKEYVGIEDVQEIAELAYEAQRIGHYVSFGTSNVSADAISVSLSIMVGGFKSGKNYTYSYWFYISDDEQAVSEMNACKHVLNSLIVESEEN